MKKAAARQAKGLPFYKLQGAGNDVVVFFRKTLGAKGAKKVDFLRRMAHRQLGIGTDQFVEVISLKPLALQIWNADGSTAEMCANGTRSFLFLAAQEKWIDAKKKQITIQVSGKLYAANRLGKNGYELGLGTPEIAPAEVLSLGAEKIPFVPVTTGNPHAVILCDKNNWRPPANFSLLNHGPRIETHPRFPKKTNVEFVRAHSKTGNTIHARVEAWERGAGATLSCGSGAVAVAAVLRRRLRGNLVLVRMTDFELRIRFEGDQGYLSGPCALVAMGEYFS